MDYTLIKLGRSGYEITELDKLAEALLRRLNELNRDTTLNEDYVHGATVVLGETINLIGYSLKD